MTNHSLSGILVSETKREPSCWGVEFGNSDRKRLKTSGATPTEAKIKSTEFLKGEKTMAHLYEMLNEAYGASTQNNNYFRDLIEQIKWDDVFAADGETYYCKENLTLTVENLDPFKQAWRPTVMIGTFFRELG